MLSASASPSASPSVLAAPSSLELESGLLVQAAAGALLGPLETCDADELQQRALEGLVLLEWAGEPALE